MLRCAQRYPTVKISPSTVKEALKDPKRVSRELQRFQKDAQILSSEHHQLIERYPNRWIAVYDGKVRAHARTLNALISKIERQGFPRDHVIIRYIDRSERTLIL